MKALGALLVLVAVGYVAYQYAYQPIADMLGLEKPKAPAVEIEPPQVVAVEPAPAPPTTPEPPPMPKLPEPAPAPPPMTMPTIPEPTTPAAPVADADGFVPPTFQPIEDLVKNWTEIPANAFKYHPPVKLAKDVNFVAEISGNKFGSKVPAGGNAVALSQEGTNIVIAPSPTAPARAKVPIDDTDLKAVLTARYENFKAMWTERKRREFMFAKNQANKPAEAATPGTPAPAGAPTKNAEGGYDVLLASMKAGQVTEITPTNVKTWGEVKKENIDGKEYFTIIVDYTTKTMFGDFDTQAQARISGGKVEKWIYTGSGEVVP
jgi:hypothetical protein